MCNRLFFGVVSFVAASLGPLTLSIIYDRGRPSKSEGIGFGNQAAGLGQVGRNRPSNQFVRAINPSEQSIRPSNQSVRAINPSEQSIRLNAASRCCQCQRPRFSWRQRSARRSRFGIGRAWESTGIGARRWSRRTVEITWDGRKTCKQTIERDSRPHVHFMVPRSVLGSPSSQANSAYRRGTVDHYSQHHANRGHHVSSIRREFSRPFPRQRHRGQGTRFRRRQ